MSDQLPLFPPPPAPPPAPAPRLAPRTPSSAPLHTLFFALQPALPDGERIAACAASDDAALGIGGQALVVARLHVSLHAVGHYGDVFPTQDVERWMRAAATVRAVPFEVVFDRAATFGGKGHPRVLRAGSEEGAESVRQFHQALGIALADAGEHITARRIEPHMTVSYRGVAAAEAPIEPIRWTARDFVLIDSHYGAGLHEVIGRWPLRA